jgi:hypothetical protein
LEWETVISPRCIERSDNTRVYVSVTQLKGGKSKPMVSFREFGHYLKKAEAEQGLTKEDMPYRPGTNGITFPVEALDSMISVLCSIRNDINAGKEVCKISRENINEFSMLKC